MRQRVSFAMAAAAESAAGGGEGPEERWVRLPCADVALLALEDLPAARWDDLWPARFDN
jgi:hypothetical protein